MRLLLALCLALLAALPAEPSWTGQWDMRWRDGGARMELRQQGKEVAGSYPAYGGQIAGTAQGRELRGQWAEGPRSGQVTFVIAPDGQSFMGRFETGEWWTGARVQAAGGGVALDQAGARQALRSFVVAGNAARPGNLNEWAKAAAAGVASIGPDGIAVELSCVLEVRSADDERADRTALMLGVLRVAERMRVRLSQDPAMPAPALRAAA